MNNFETIYQETIQNLVIKGEVATIPYSGQSLILIARNLDEPQYRLVEEAVLKKQNVTLITSNQLSTHKRSQLLELMTDYEKNESNPDLLMFRIFKNIGYGLIVVGLVLLIVFFASQYINLPFQLDSLTIQYLLPLLITYLGFVLVDWMDRLQLKRFKVRPNLELHVLKKKQFKTKDAMIILDERSGYMTKKHDHSEFKLSAAIVNQIARMIIEVRKMSKKEKIDQRKLISWLYEG